MADCPDNLSATSMPLTVLVTDASYKHSVGIIRTLGRAGHTICAVSHHSLAAGFRSRYTTRRAVVANPLGDAPGFSETVLRAALAWKVDVIIPVGYASVSAIVHNPVGFLSAGLKPVLPTGEEFDRCADKWTIVQIARGLGVQTPDTILATSHPAIRDFVGAHGQCVAKYRKESDGQGVVYLDESKDWEGRLASKPATMRPDGTPNLIIQERIRGIGQGYMALAWHGRIVREFAHRRLREMPPTGGAATAAISIQDESLMNAGRRLVEEIGWHGPVMVEFRSNESGHYLMELNPKYWGSLELAIACGADFPGDHCRLSLGDDLNSRPIPSYRPGVRFWWPWRGDLRRLVQRPGDAVSLLRDLFTWRVQSNWAWSDPVPNIIEIASELTYPLRRHQ